MAKADKLNGIFTARNDANLNGKEINVTLLVDKVTLSKRKIIPIFISNVETFFWIDEWPTDFLSSFNKSIDHKINQMIILSWSCFNDLISFFFCLIKTYIKNVPWFLYFTLIHTMSVVKIFLRNEKNVRNSDSEDSNSFKIDKTQRVHLNLNIIFKHGTATWK